MLHESKPSLLLQKVEMLSIHVWIIFICKGKKCPPKPLVKPV